MRNRGLALTGFLLAVLLGGCGGGGGLASLADDPGGGGIGGTGVTSSGTVSGFGSVFVNGIEFATDEAEITVNGVRRSEDALGLGMVVTVKGVVNDDGVTGVADTVIFDGAVQGPVSSLTRGAHGDVLLLGVLGVEIIVEGSATVFQGVTFATIRLNDLVEVSGFVDDQGRLQATRLEKKSDFVPDESEIDRAGLVVNLSATEFSLGEFSVDFSAADVSSLPGGAVAQGQRVLVSGTLNDTTITAREIRLVAEVSRDLVASEDLILQGTVTEFDSVSRFVVRGVAVDASDATLELSSDELNNGLIVQVSGVWNGERLLARRVSSLQARMVVAAPVDGVNIAQGRLSLFLYNNSVSLLVNTGTLIEDGTRQRDRLRLSDISTGDYLVVEALARGDTRLALRVNRKEVGDNVLRAAVEGFVPGTEITLQGLSISTVGAEFFSLDNMAIDVDAFYAQLAIGDLVRITDRQTVGGRVDEVRRVSTDVAPTPEQTIKTQE